MIYEIILIIVSQFAFVFVRTLNIKYTAHDNLLGAMITGLMINVLWITTTYYGIKAFNENNLLLATAYLSGGQLGIYWGMRKNIINKIFKSLLLKWHKLTSHG